MFHRNIEDFKLLHFTKTQNKIYVQTNYILLPEDKNVFSIWSSFMTCRCLDELVEDEQNISQLKKIIFQTSGQYLSWILKYVSCRICMHYVALHVSNFINLQDRVQHFFIKSGKSDQNFHFIHLEKNYTNALIYYART